MKRVKKWCLSLLIVIGTICMAMSAVMAFAAGETSGETEPAATYTKLATEGHVTVSSVLAQPDDEEHRVWEISKLSNAGRGNWSAQWGYTSNESCDEWVKFDLTEVKTIGKINVHNETGAKYARCFVIYGSKDGVSQSEIVRYEDGDWTSNELSFVFDPIEVRYVTINIRQKGNLDASNYLVELANVEIFETDQAATEYKGYTDVEYTVTADETFAGSLDSLKDGKSGEQTALQTPYWTGGLKGNSETDTDTLIFDAGSVMNLGGLALFPRMATAGGPCTVYGFPKDFNISVSSDGETYKPVAGQSYTDYTAKIFWNEFTFRKPVSGRYLKFSVTKRGLSGTDHLTQLMEAKLYKADFEPVTVYTKLTPTAATSSGIWAAGHEAENVYDGNLSTDWAAPWGYAEHKYADEWITLDYGEEKIIGKIVLKVGDVMQPKGFRVLVSGDNETWGMIGESYDTEWTANTKEFTFDSVEARYVKVQVFEKGLNGSAYLSAFTEIETYAADDDEAAGFVEIYQDLTSEVTVTEVTSVFADNFGKDKLTDGVTANKTASTNEWMSGAADKATVDASATPTGFDGFYFGFDEVKNIDKLSLFPRFDATPGYSIGFPVSFNIIWSNDKQIWYAVDGCNKENYQLHAGWNDFEFAKTVKAKYIGLNVTVRGLNGELYTIEISEAKVFAVTNNSNKEVQAAGTVVVDNSKLTVGEFTPEEVNYTYNEIKIKLSDYFAYSMDGALAYTVKQGGGEIVEESGEFYYVYMPETAGNEKIEIECVPADKENKKGSLIFDLVIVDNADPDVVLKKYSLTMEYAVGVSVRIDLDDVFLYEGDAKLNFTAEKGTIEKAGDKTYFVYKCETAGENTISVTATPEGKAEKAKTFTLTFNVKENGNDISAQPPKYDVTPVKKGGCGATVMSLGAAVAAVGLFAVALVKKEK